MLTFQYPTNLTLNRVLQEYVIQRDKLRGIQIVPFLDFFTQKVRWDILDNIRGLTRTHVMGTDPKIGIRPGSVLKEYEPFYFKEADLIKEDEILRARELGTLGGVVNLDALVARTMKARVDRNFLRAEWLVWGMLTGLIQLNDDNVKAAETFPIQTAQTDIPFSNHDQAKPLAFFNSIRLKFRGTGAGAQGATAFMNQTTCNDILENANDKDIHGFRAQNFATLTYDLEQVNKILQTRGLPTIEVYDEGYYDDAGQFQLFIPNGTVVVVGKRPAGEVVGNFGLTPSLHNENGGMPAPGFFSFILVNGDANPGAQASMGMLGASGNPKIEIIGGMYGGPVLWYPRSVIACDVTHQA